MSELIVVAYEGERTAGEVLDTLQRLRAGHLIDLEDAAYVTRDPRGKVKLHQSVNLGAASAASGGLWGALIGMFFLMPFMGAAVGAGAGYLVGRFTDIGIDDAFARQLGEQLQPGTSVLFILVRQMTPDKVLPEMRQYGGTVLQTSLADDAEARLRAALAPATPPAPAA